MIKIKNKKSIFKRILAFSGALMCAFAFCFGIVNINNNHKETLQVSADSYEDQSVIFNGSQLWFPYDNVYMGYTTTQGYHIVRTYDYSNSAMPENWLTYNLKISFTKDLDNNLLLYMPFSDFTNADGYGYYITGNIGNFSYGYSNVLNVSDFRNGYIYFLRTEMFDTASSIRTYLYCDNNFNYTDVIGVEMYMENDVNGEHVFVRYFDSNDFDLSLCIYVADVFELPYRRYYFSNSIDLTDNQYYNQGYATGQTDGYNSGYTAGQNKGYNDGYTAGELFGYNNGYDAGLEDSNQYSFLSLVSSVIDAPMTYFTSLFNFELLGVNLQGFLMALFTLCVIVTIVRLCLGG